MSSARDNLQSYWRKLIKTFLFLQIIAASRPRRHRERGSKDNMRRAELSTSAASARVEEQQPPVGVLCVGER